MGSVAGESELADRMEREQKKAIEKYGEIALRPEGHPDYDIIDYLINEVVGMIRYGEMMRARVIMMYNMNVINYGHMKEGELMAEHIIKFNMEAAVNLIDFRNFLKRKGLMLGEPERR